MQATADPLLAELESDWAVWLATLFPGHFSRPMGDFHVALWDHVWRIREGVRPRPRIECWFRDSAKTTSAQGILAALACRGVRRYGIYIARTQDLADDKVQNVAGFLESKTLGLFYPEHADRRVGKFGAARAWRRNRLWTRGGFILDALGLDKAARGLLQDEDGQMLRPDLIIIDDVDDEADSTPVVTKIEKRITQKILPARGPSAAVFFFQNLIHDDGVMGRRLAHRSDWLADAIVTGPVPAVEGLEYERRLDSDGMHRYHVTKGRPTWAGFDLEAVQHEINTSGITAFLTEHQHEPQDVAGGMFSHLDFETIRVTRDKLPPMDDVVVWVDPASEGDEGKSCQAVICDGLGRDRRIYRLDSYEQHGTPLSAMKVAFRFAIAEGARSIGVETDTGGKAWRSVFAEAKLELGAEAEGITYRFTKAAGQGSKEDRASRMLVDYERDVFRHVEGTHHVLERALRRFPQEPKDLVDVCYHSWKDLRGEIVQEQVLTYHEPSPISPY